MGVAYNNSIVRDGLVLHLDAANPKSYPGSGTTWFDLSGNGNDVTLVNGIVYSSDNIGSLTFDGVDDYIYPISFNSNPFANSFTAEIFCYVNDINSRIISQDRSTNNPNTLLINYPSFNNLTFLIVDSNQNGYGNFRGSMVPNQWNHIAMTINFDTSELISYRNNSPSEPVDISSFTGVLENILFIGSSGEDVGNMEGGIGLMKIYNRALSESEIQQNFNAMRDRYGI